MFAQGMTITKLRKIRASRKTLTKKLDHLLHEIVVLRDKCCVICRTKNNLQAGHLFTRSYGRIKYDLMNVHCQCASHNYIHEFKPDIFTKWFLDKYGVEKYNELFTEAHKPSVPIKTFQLEEMIRQFEVILKELRGRFV